MRHHATDSAGWLDKPHAPILFRGTQCCCDAGRRGTVNNHVRTIRSGICGLNRRGRQKKQDGKENGEGVHGAKSGCGLRNEREKVWSIGSFRNEDLDNLGPRQPGDKTSYQDGAAGRRRDSPLPQALDCEQMTAK